MSDCDPGRYPCSPRRFGWLAILCLAACSWLPARDSTPLPPIVTDAPSAVAYASLTAVTQAALNVPASDPADLAARLRLLDTSPAAPLEPRTYQVGDVELFWYKNLATNQSERVQATLLYRSDSLNLWLQAGETIRPERLQTAAQTIETHILPTTRALFGGAWAPGVDGDRRLNILHLRQIGGVARAYISTADEVTTAVNPYSNQRHMLYVSLRNNPVGSQTYYSAIAHELQHLIQRRLDPNEDAWLNEGFSEAAVHLNGYPTGREAQYARQPDVQLTDLRQEQDIVAAHYAAATLFVTYFLDRFGETALQNLAQQPANGVHGFNQALADVPLELTTQSEPLGQPFDGLFAAWLAANYLEGIDRGEGIYQYQSLTLPAIRTERIGRLPTQRTAAVHQYGADFIEIRSDMPVTVIFTGTQQIPLVDAAPHSGDYFWFSYPADASAVSLTRAFDLSGLTTATLTFWTWYNLEAGWDYGYVMASADNGRTWDLLTTDSTTLDNPQGNSFGPGFTGNSGGGREPVWVQETADLTPYVGRSILLRFQVVTDGAVHDQGFIIDDIAIPQLGYTDDVEAGPAGWTAEGFARTGYLLPQQFIVQRILIGETAVRLDRLPLDENQRGRWQFPMDDNPNLVDNYHTAVLIVAGRTPVTRHAAVYAYEIYRDKD